MGKTGTSVVKTTVKIVMEENSSQVNNGLLMLSIYSSDVIDVVITNAKINWRQLGSYLWMGLAPF